MKGIHLWKCKWSLSVISRMWTLFKRCLAFHVHTMILYPYIVKFGLFKVPIRIRWLVWSERHSLVYVEWNVTCSSLSLSDIIMFYHLSGSDILFHRHRKKNVRLCECVTTVVTERLKLCYRNLANSFFAQNLRRVL